MNRKMRIMIIFLLALWPLQSMAQEKLVMRIKRVEVDQREINKYRVFLHLGSKKVRLRKSRKGFIVPLKLKNYEKFGVQFLFGKYNLYFRSVYLGHLKAKWTVGVHTKAFILRSLGSERANNLKFIYYLGFEPPDGENTTLFVEVNEMKKEK